MMKPARPKSLSPIMERHTPQHPLPEEIKNLPQDETVCQFCGVSYLIHHEIKKLEELVEQLEKELKQNRGAVEREQKLREELEKNRNAVEYTNQILRQKDEVISKITGDVEALKTSNGKLQSELYVEQQQRNELSNNFLLHKQKVKSVVSKFQIDTQYLKSELIKVKSDSNHLMDDMADSVTSILTKIPEFAKVCYEDYSSIKEKNEKLAKASENTFEEISQWEEKVNRKDEEIMTLQESLQSSGLSQSHREKDMKERIKELEDNCRDLKLSANTTEAQLKSLQANSALMEDKLKKKQTELQSVCVKLQKSEENATDTIQRMVQDCRNAERELVVARDELRKLKEAQKQKTKKEEELFKQTTLNNCQIEEITKALAEARSSNQSLIEERSLMVMSHQHQIQQLRDNFKRMLQERDGSANAQKEIEIICEKHKEALRSLEKELKSEFHIEMSVEKDKQSQTILHLKTQQRNEIKELDTRHRTELSPYKNQVAALSQKLESLTKSTEEKQNQCEEEKSTLKDLINHLETRITQITGEQEGHASLNKLEVVAVNQKLQESLKENESLQESLLTIKEEVSLLQDTVHRECEERFELTEALSQARQQLKEGKVSNSLSPNSLTSINPVSALNKLNPNGIEAEPSNRLSSRTLRSLESEYSSPQPGVVRNGQIPSLRSLPDVLPRPHPRPSSHLESNSVSTNITDISFGNKDVAPRKSSSNSSLNGHHSPGRSPVYNPGRNMSLTRSESAESVDVVRKRIAAAIKRK